MSLRLKQGIVFLGLLACGAAITPGTISGDATRVLTIFLGLFSASILPTVSLIINSMTANSRSVHALDALEKELEAAMDALFFLFGCIGVAIGALLALSIPPPGLLTSVPYLTTEILPRIGQALVVAPTAMVVQRAGQITGILRRSLKLRHQIAVEEAKSKLEKNAPTGNSTRQMFPTHPDYGKVVAINELQTKETQQ